MLFATCIVERLWVKLYLGKVGPPCLDSSRQTWTEGSLSIDQFNIDWTNEQVIRAQGKTSQVWNAYARDSGLFYWSHFTLKTERIIQYIRFVLRSSRSYRFELIGKPLALAAIAGISTLEGYAVVPTRLFIALFS